MAIWVGTSGYNYPEWRGSFYPEKFATTRMLPYYAQRLASVEINYTFYRSPNPAILAGWSSQTPPGFKFTLKAPKRITHDARLRDCAESLKYFLDTAATLGPKLGMLLFQLPPFFKRDLAVLDTFLEAFPPETRAAFEFRHSSWLKEEVFERLRARNLTLCVADNENSSTPVAITSDCGYFRLRDEGYIPGDIEQWARTIQEKTARCRDVYVYFKHEEAGKGPQFARQLLAALGLAAG
ncbi:MAG TPA: DUF72 domain-containing protein [Steroidobacteraceae bacterium]|jgi:uncharacterized protein YecE (DUF72 family)|nr:DUF72 domain-containing protein [Steroidobacteraceae bacterium]